MSYFTPRTYECTDNNELYLNTRGQEKDISRNLVCKQRLYLLCPEIAHTKATSVSDRNKTHTHADKCLQTATHWPQRIVLTSVLMLSFCDILNTIIFSWAYNSMFHSWHNDCCVKTKMAMVFSLLCELLTCSWETGYEVTVQQISCEEYYTYKNENFVM